MNIKACFLLTSCAIANMVSAPSVQAASVFYGGDAATDTIFQIDPATGQLSNFVPVSLPGASVIGITALTANPVNNSMWGVLRIVGGDRVLATVDPVTGSATQVGSFGSRRLSSLAFDSSGTLYGVTGDGDALLPETLYAISTVNATMTLQFSLGNGDDGEIVAFGPGGALYHSSGNGTAEFELINLGPQTTTPIGVAVGEMFGMGYDPDSGTMYGSGISSDFFSIDLATGARTLIGVNANNIDIRGLAIVPEPGGSLLALGGLTLLGMRRRRK